MTLLERDRIALFYLFVDVLTLSVCFADSSPKVGAKKSDAYSARLPVYS